MSGFCPFQSNPRDDKHEPGGARYVLIPDRRRGQG
jgi:hypothetical protein